MDNFPNDQEDTFQSSIEEKHAQRILERTRERLPSGKFQIGVLWKEGEPNLQNNYGMALDRMRKLYQGKALRDPIMRDRYSAVFQDWLKKGYVRIVEKAEERPQKAFYLCHFPVIKEGRSTTKIRPVMDASAKFKGKSLNDAVAKGPLLMNDLVVVLTRFRRNRIAIGGDVSEMFLQVFMRPEDRVFHRFLWSFDGPKAEAKELEFLSHVFGNPGSPCVAMFATQSAASDLMDQVPRACESVLYSTIIDDVLDSVQTESEGVKLITDLQKIYGSCGMEIRKFCSNSLSVLKTVPKEDRATSLDISAVAQRSETEEFQTIKTLGIRWEAETDEFFFSCEKPDKSVWTKREILGFFSRIFDPLGFLCPYIVMARMFMQELWAIKSSWDEKLQGSTLKGWISWLENLPEIEKIRITRPLNIHQHPRTVQLHCFADASSKAYAAVCYCRTVGQDGQVKMTFALARVRVAPVKHECERNA